MEKDEHKNRSSYTSTEFSSKGVSCGQNPRVAWDWRRESWKWGWNRKHLLTHKAVVLTSSPIPSFIFLHVQNVSHPVLTQATGFPPKKFKHAAKDFAIFHYWGMWNTEGQFHISINECASCWWVNLITCSAQNLGFHERSLMSKEIHIANSRESPLVIIYCDFSSALHKHINPVRYMWHL